MCIVRAGGVSGFEFGACCGPVAGLVAQMAAVLSLLLVLLFVCSRVTAVQLGL